MENKLNYLQKCVTKKNMLTSHERFLSLGGINQNIWNIWDYSCNKYVNHVPAFMKLTIC